MLLAVVMALLVLSVRFTTVYVKAQRKADTKRGSKLGGVPCFALGGVIVKEINYARLMHFFPF
ncbi:MAG: hypothetical protein DRG83_14075 [Deltaproteobacteria bacterium]|nr:MAG: hypothetical protein DRG83_14075 [Deltaproteobacteria bacterium]